MRDGAVMPSGPSCLLAAWAAHEGELRGFLLHRAPDRDEVDDLLQEVFIRALRRDGASQSIANYRAWFFQVARHALIDRLRRTRPLQPLPDDIPAVQADEAPAVDDLSQCLPRVLAELSEADRLAIIFCDIEGRPQQALAEHLGLSLAGAKSRLQRARRRLRETMEKNCQVRFDEDGKVCCFTPRPPR